MVDRLKFLSLFLILIPFFAGNRAFAQDDGFVSMPSPLQIVMIFQSPDLTFDSTLINPPSKADTYKNEYRQILNYGVYLADLAYCIQNNENETAVKYLHVLKKIGARANMNQYFDKYDLYNRFEKNIENKDSMMTILLDMSLIFEAFVGDKELMRVVGIQFAGIWIEGAYIASQNASFESEESLNKILVHQYPVLENIVNVLKSVESADPLHKEFSQGLEDLIIAMSKMKTIKKFMKKKNEIPLTEAELKIVEEKIRRIRQKVIE